jgi:hypothetical protein
MDEHIATPAGRLWLYFSHMAAQLDTNRPVREVAASYFGVESSDTGAYMTVMSQLVGLPDAVHRQVTGIEKPIPPSRVLLRPLLRVREAFNADPMGANPVDWLLNQVPQDVLDGLETTSYVLLDQQPTLNPEIAPNALARIHDLAQEIIRLATESDELDTNAREAFVRFGHRIAEAADLYKVAGAQPLVDELDRFHSESHRVQVSRNSQVWEKFKQVTAAIVTAVNLFSAPLNVHNAIEGYTELFTLPETTLAPGQIPLPDAAQADPPSQPQD